MKMIQTNESNRERKIYMLAIDREENLDRLDPPATEKEIAWFNKISAEMRQTEKEYAQQGKSLVWDIPFDLD